MNKELTSLKSNLEEISRIKQAIKKAILDLPDNPNIKRIGNSPKCFVMNSKDLFGAGNNWTVFYHDFKAQYEKIAEIVENSKADTIISNLNHIITTGHLLGRDYQKFHSSVIANLKAIL